MIVSQEKEILLFKEAGNADPSRTNQRDGGDPGQEAGAGDQPEHWPGRARPRRIGSLATADPSRGYREELEHFAYCVRHGDA